MQSVAWRIAPKSLGAACTEKNARKSCEICRNLPNGDESLLIDSMDADDDGEADYIAQHPNVYW